jgi:hypothetical protein
MNGVLYFDMKFKNGNCIILSFQLYYVSSLAVDRSLYNATVVLLKSLAWTHQSNRPHHYHDNE